MPLAPAHALYWPRSTATTGGGGGERLQTLRADADGRTRAGGALVAESGGGRRRRVPEARAAHIMSVEARGRMRKWVGELDSEG